MTPKEAEDLGRRATELVKFMGELGSVAVMRQMETPGDAIARGIVPEDARLPQLEGLDLVIRLRAGRELVIQARTIGAHTPT